MKLPDTNVLVYAVNTAAPQHTAALRWLKEAFIAPAGVGFAWVSLLGFVRVSTRRGILASPLAVVDALRTMNFWLDQPRARLVQPTERHADLISDLLLAAGSAGNLTTDAHLAALAIEHGATLGSFDGDFDQFKGLSFERLRAKS
jgi:uncharacterized protein